MAINVQIKGLKELEARFKDLDKKFHKEVSGIVERGAQLWVSGAKRQAPIDMGWLAGAITYYPVEQSKHRTAFRIVSGKEYSPYVEWGTITRVNVPADLQGYAVQFKGRGIKKNGGIFPRPFFFPQRPIVKASVEKGISAIARDLK